MNAAQNPQPKKRSLYFSTGLVISLAFVLLAFEWKSFNKEIVRPDYTVTMDIEEDFIPITFQKPEKPKPVLPKKPITKQEPMTDDFKLVEDFIDDPDADKILDQETAIEPVEFFGDEDVVDIDPVPFYKLEEYPEFPGGEKEMIKFLADELKYPQLAKEAGMTGTAYIEFVVEADGSISHVGVKKGIAGARLLDLEAMRVVKSMPNWKPGKQRGRPVRVPYVIPIAFNLKKS